MNKWDWEKIGNLPVDAGCILLSDPCYVLPDSRYPNEDEQVEIPYDYATMLEEMKVAEWPRVFNVQPKNYSNPLGLIVESGYGDGLYPVYAKFNKEGRLIQVMIDFDEDWDEEDDSDY